MGMVTEADQSSVVLGGLCSSDGLGFVIVRKFMPTTFLDCRPQSIEILLASSYNLHWTFSMEIELHYVSPNY